MDRIGEYFFVLCNEVNLCGVDCVWLVFGVNDKLCVVVGMNYCLELDWFNNLKN